MIKKGFIFYIVTNDKIKECKVTKIVKKGKQYDYDMAEYIHTREAHPARHGDMGTITNSDQDFIPIELIVDDTNIVVTPKTAKIILASNLRKTGDEIVKEIAEATKSQENNNDALEVLQRLKI